MKAGYAEDDAARLVFPTLTSQHNETTYMGDDAMVRGHSGWAVRHPIESRAIANWDDMEAIWRHTFSQLKVSSEEAPVMFSEPPLNPKRLREQMTQVIFETFGVPAMYVSVGAVLSIYSAGETCGLVLDSGHGGTHVVPIYEGYGLPTFIKCSDIAGQYLTSYLASLLKKFGNPSSIVYRTTERARRIKEDACYVAADFHHHPLQPKNYTLPDGKQILLGEERFSCPEVLFNPGLVGAEASGIHEMIHEVISSTHSDIHAPLYSNIILSGGSTMFPGIGERLEREVLGLAPAGTELDITASPERKYSTWIGGSVLSSLSTFEAMWITEDEYNEEGPNIVNRKCY